MQRTAIALAVVTACLTTQAETRQRSGGTGAAQSGATPSPSIAGRVVDPGGNGVYGAFVTALRPEPTDGRLFRFVSAQLGVTTDGEGRFQLSGVPFGEVYVVALPHNIVFDNGATNRAGFANTFYPNALSAKDARRVTLKPGIPPDLTIVLRTSRLAVVSGHVIAADAKPPNGGLLHISTATASSASTRARCGSCATASSSRRRSNPARISSSIARVRGHRREAPKR